MKKNNDNNELPSAKKIRIKKSPLVASAAQSFPIVAIGGSAGSFQAFEKFFMHMPVDSGMAFVIIMHLDPTHAGNVAEVIQTFSNMPVAKAEDGIRVKPNHVYVIPPNKDMGIHNQKLLLLSISKTKGYHLPIDYFLQSLAEDQWNKSVAIVLSGMGSDGETGVRMIKENLGMVMVQDPATAQFESMPKAAIGTNLVDYVLAPEEMPIKLIRYLNHPAISDVPVEKTKSDIRDINAVQKILMLLRSHNGHDFSLYKKNTITRRIDRRIAFHQLPDYTHYINYLRENPHEIDVLFNELLIGVTKFFRDAPAFESLQEKLYTILRHKKENDPVRVWVAGCSTGEEAYTIAMLLIECFAAMGNKFTPKIQIFATDLDTDAIETARAGIYQGNIVADVSPERITQFFEQKNNKLQVKKELREMIVFAQHNLIKDAPFTRLDLLSCRNVMIYLNTELQRKIIPIFHYSLNPKGILLLGPAETIGGFSEIFAPIDPKWKIFEHKEGSSTIAKIVDFPFNVSRHNPISQKIDSAKTLQKKSLSDSFNKLLLDTYTPVSILVNDSGDILYINGKTGKFLELNTGEAIINIFEIVKEELKYVLSNAVHQARVQKTVITVDDIKLKEDQNLRLVSIKINILEESDLNGLILIILEDKGIIKPKSKKKTPADRYTNVIAEELQKELDYTKQQLNSTIEQMETSLEELKSTNEELQSTNEELQSTNEESLTTKEEMQSLNEELMTINTSYQSKAEELTRLNNDMKNLLDNTEIGTIFLDNELLILRFTPQVKTLFNVIAADIGRSITDIVFNFNFPDFKQVITGVIDTLFPKDLEIKTKQNEWYNLRIMPYRTLDNFISGVVLTFTNITKLKIAQHKMESLIEYSKGVLNFMPLPAILLNDKEQVIGANDDFMTLFNFDAKDLKGKIFSHIAHELWNTTALDKMIKNVSNRKMSVLLELNFPKIGQKSLRFTSISSVYKATGEFLLVLIVVEDLARRLTLEK